MSKTKMKARALAFLLSEANGNRSRNEGVIDTGAGVVEAGTVLGKVTATGKYVPSPHAQVVGIEGAETAVAILGYGVDASTGDMPCVVVDLDAEVKLPMLKFDASIDDQAKTDAKLAQLATVGIRAR